MCLNIFTFIPDPFHNRLFIIFLIRVFLKPVLNTCSPVLYAFSSVRYRSPNTLPPVPPPIFIVKHIHTIISLPFAPATRTVFRFRHVAVMDDDDRNAKFVSLRSNASNVTRGLYRRRSSANDARSSITRSDTSRRVRCEHPAIYRYQQSGISHITGFRSDRGETNYRRKYYYIFSPHETSANPVLNPRSQNTLTSIITFEKLPYRCSQCFRRSFSRKRLSRIHMKFSLFEKFIFQSMCFIKLTTIFKSDRFRNQKV